MCNCCETILSSTATTAVNSTAGTFVITPSITLSPENEQRIKILITTPTPAAGAALPVTIALNGSSVSVLDKYGNQVYGNQIYDNMVIKGYFGNNGIGATGHLQLIKVPHRYYYY